MNTEIRNLQNNSNVHLWEIEYGGLSKEQLKYELDKASIKLNKYANILFESDVFIPSKIKRKAEIVELSISDLGFDNGSTLYEIIKRIKAKRFSLCPLEIGPFFRLVYRDQKEEIEEGKNKAPKGSITIISKPLKEKDDDFPKGFYIRKIDGELWLRGYICQMDYVWNKEDRIAIMA